MAGAWGVSMMKNEVDVAYGVVMHMASEGLAGIIVADNGSTDGTRDALESAARDAGVRLRIIDDPEVGYYQSRKMTALAHRAGVAETADWIVPFDADEIWYSPGWTSWPLAEVLEAQPDDVMICGARLFNHWTSSTDPADETDPFRRIRQRQAEAQALPKVAVRWRADLTIHQGNHDAHYGDPHAPTPVLRTTELEIRHFPYRSLNHFIRKARQGAAAYAATDLPEWYGAHWRSYGEMSDEALADAYHEWFNDMDDMVDDPAPYRRRG